MEDRLKILFLVNVPSPYRVAFFNELGKISDLTVLFERKSASDRNKDWHDYKFENFKGIYLKGLKYKADKGINFDVIKYMDEKSYDHIIIGGYSTPTGMFAIIYLNYKKIPFILNIDGGMKNIKESKIKRLIKRYFISSAYGWLSTGRIASAYLEYYGAEKDNIFIYPFTTLYNKDILSNIVDIEEKIELRKKLNLNGKYIVTCVSRFIESKGIDILIKAWENVSEDSSLYIIGGSPSEEYINILNASDIKNIYFIDFIGKEELKKYYKASDLFVLPTRGDVWGLVINEAMACGLPVVTTEGCVAGMELIEDYKNGFIIKVDNKEMLSDKINQILNNKELINTMSNNNLMKIRKYTLENMAAETLRGINSITEGR